MPRNWRPVVGYEGFYEVSDDGLVRRNLNSPFAKGVECLKPETTKNNRYPRVTLSRNGSTKRYHVHTLVLTAFRGPKPEGLCGRHLNDNPMDNRLDNLIWGTYSDNYWDQHKNGGWKPRGKDKFKREPYKKRAA